MTYSVAEIEAVLEAVDEECHRKGQPILSCLTRTDDDQISPVFLRSVEKYGLRRPGESDAAVYQRLLAEAYAFNRKRQ
jgi:hypothetical protein